MSLTIDDIRRALLNRGHSTILDTILKKALKNPPLTGDRDCFHGALKTPQP